MQMTIAVVEPDPESNAKLNAFLDDRIYEFNIQSTGFQDGRAFQSVVTDDSGDVIGAVTGHTWGGCCHVVYLWIHESRRRSGLGTSLLLAVEAEARLRGCGQSLLFTHSFQAPAFYEKLGYIQVAAVPNYPLGHAQFVYVKRLA